MRIIAGEKRGCTFEAPERRDTRPTLDRVREAIFGMIQFDIAGSFVLDLFAGSGAMGLEALSRYAESAVFCDRSRPVAQLIERNLGKLGFSQRGRVHCCEYTQAIAACARAGCGFDIVFLDPPYEYGLIEPAINTMAESGVLNEGCLIVAEYAAALPPAIPGGFRERSVKRYGEVGVSIIVKDVEA